MQIASMLASSERCTKTIAGMSRARNPRCAGGSVHAHTPTVQEVRALFPSPENLLVSCRRLVVCLKVRLEWRNAFSSAPLLWSAAR